MDQLWLGHFMSGVTAGAILQTGRDALATISMQVSTVSIRPHDDLDGNSRSDKHKTKAGPST